MEAVVVFDRTQLKTKFKTLENLEEIDLSESDLELIDANIFNGLYKLKEIDLSVNRIKLLDGTIFSGLVTLTEIN